jgi:SAM-dependent methyltransferase
MNPFASTSTPDYETIKTRQQATWASGDFGLIGVLLQIVGESLCEAVDVRSGEAVLDVAAGNGNASLAAARRFADVTSTDYVPELLAQGARRAEADGLPMVTRVADAERLPFLQGEFFVPPPAGLLPASAWGTEARIDELFGAQASSMRAVRRSYVFRNHSAEHWIHVFRGYYGPVLKAFEALDADRQQELHAALLELLERHNTGGSGTLVVPAEYLEVVIVRR